jgi:cytochrome c oxidase subunit 2
VTRPSDRGRRPRARTGAGLAGLGALALTLLLTGCSPADIPNMLGIPDPHSEQSKIIFDLWQGSWVAAWLVGILVWGLILWAVIVYRRRGHEAPPQTRYNLPIEALYTITPLIVIGVLFAFTARDELKVLEVKNDQKQTVNVVGFRWNWTFNYVDENVYDVGSPAQLSTLYLPVGQKVRFELTSPDVIHSFWVPDFLFKMDDIPGRKNTFELTPTVIGTYDGRCAELCGVGHSRMLFRVKVVSAEDFQAHMAELRARGQVGLLETGQVIDTIGTQQGRTTGGGNP